MKKIIIFAVLIFSFLPGRVAAFDVAQNFKITDGGAIDGDILVSGPAGFIRAQTPYDNNIFGVYSQNPPLVFHVASEEGRPIVRSGTAAVNVTTANGPIKSGDYVTSSTDPGKGQKATNSGYVLGVALGDFSGSGTGKIQVAIKIEYAELTAVRSANRLWEYLGASFLTNVKNPEKFGLIVRYIAAGLLLLLTFGLGFWTFSKAVPKSIEAIGRNPLAKNTIYVSLALHVVLIAVIGGLGIIGALLILRL